MLPDFSEFSFGFAFTNEYIRRNPGLMAAPELPSLIREAEKGYDLKLAYRGHAKFFQFKLSAYMSRRNAMHWSTYNRSHYRVRVSSKGRLGERTQHRQLKLLAETTKHVLYIAPKFHRETEFNYLFLRDQITDNSMWSPLSDLPWASDNKDHYLTFTRTQSRLDWHSEAHGLEGHFTAEEHYEMISERSAIDEQYFRQLRANLIAATNEPDRDGDAEFVDVLRDTHRLLTTRLGLQMVILVEPSEEDSR